MIDAVVLVLRDPEAERGHEAFDLLRAAAADNGGGDSWMMEGPGDGDDAGLDIVAAADFAEEFDETEVA